VRPPSAIDRLTTLLEHTSPSDPGVRQLTEALRRTAQMLAEQLDYYQHLVEVVGPTEAARMAVNAARATHRGWVDG